MFVLIVAKSCLYFGSFMFMPNMAHSCSCQIWHICVHFYASCGAFAFMPTCTLPTLERPKCTLFQMWHNVHSGYSRETKVHIVPNMEHPCLYQLWHNHVYTNFGLIYVHAKYGTFAYIFMPIVAHLRLYQLWHICVSTNFGTFITSPSYASSCQ